MQIPKKLKIGGMVYNVKIVDPMDVDNRTAGLINTEKSSIRVVKGDQQFMDITFLHEIFHAVNMEFEEQIIEFLAQAFYQVVVDNPHIFEGGVQHGKK